MMFSLPPSAWLRAMAATATMMLAELHGSCFRRLCAALGRHHEGLAVAARHARRQRLLPGPICKKLERVDVAFALVRHLTTVKVNDFLSDLDDLLVHAELVVEVNHTVLDDELVLEDAPPTVLEDSILTNEFHIPPGSGGAPAAAPPPDR